MKQHLLSTTILLVLGAFAGASLLAQAPTGEESAWDARLRANPELQSDGTVGPLERQIFAALSESQANAWLDGADPASLSLRDGSTLADLLEKIGRVAASPGLLFHPVPACVFANSRAIPNNHFVAPETRSYFMTPEMGDLSAQGGSSTGCAIPSNAKAAMVNVKIIPISGKGRLSVFPANGVETAPVANFSAVDDFPLNNTTVVELCDGECHDVSVSMIANVPTTAGITLAVVGYFTEPTADADTLAGLSCADGEVAKSNGAGVWACSEDIDTDTNDLADLSCTNGQVAKSDGEGGWACADDTDTNGLAGLTCTNGQVAKSNGSGGWICSDDTDTNSLAGLTCTNGQVAKSNGSGGWICGDDTDTTIANTDALGSLSCATGQIAKLTAQGWACAADNAGGADPNVSSALCELYFLTGETPPQELSCPTQVVRIAFVSSAIYDGNLGGVSGADQKCNGLATAAQLPGTYKAWIADNNASTAPDQRFDKGGATDKFQLTDGNFFAIGWDDLTDGTLARAINVDESGATISSTWATWTNVAADGTRETTTTTCENWTDNTFVLVGSNYCSDAAGTQDHGAQGAASVSTASWTNGGSYCCDSTNGTGNPTTNPNAFRRLFCFQDLPQE